MYIYIFIIIFIIIIFNTLPYSLTTAGENWIILNPSIILNSTRPELFFIWTESSKGYFQFEIIINVLVSFFCLIENTYVMGLRLLGKKWILLARGSN